MFYFNINIYDRIMEELKWKVWRISKGGGGLHGRAHKGDVWECSNIGGLVRKNGVILESFVNTGDIFNGYIILKESGYRVHRIVAETWVENPDKSKYKYVDHIDTDKTNNDANNLRWTTSCGNMNNPITLKKISEGKLRYGKFKDDHKSHISEAAHKSQSLMTDKQRRIRFNPYIKGIYLKLNKATQKYEYYDSRKAGANKLTEEQVNDMLFQQGYDSNANIIR